MRSYPAHLHSPLTRSPSHAHRPKHTDECGGLNYNLHYYYFFKQRGHTHFPIVSCSETNYAAWGWDQEQCGEIEGGREGVRQTGVRGQWCVKISARVWGEVCVRRPACICHRVVFHTSHLSHSHLSPRVNIYKPWNSFSVHYTHTHTTQCACALVLLLLLCADSLIVWNWLLTLASDCTLCRSESY